MKVSTIQYEDLTRDVVDKILFDGIADSTLCGDCIMVLGSISANKYRIPKAAELYHGGRSNKLLVCGGIVRETEYGQVCEASAMKEKLLALDVPAEDIFIEDMSSSTIENFICSLYVLERNLKLTNIKAILLVTTRFHMRRSMMMAEAFMPKWINILPCPANDKNTLRHNWYLREKNAKTAKDEAYKIAYYIREGCIADFEI